MVISGVHLLVSQHFCRIMSSVLVQLCYLKVKCFKVAISSPRYRKRMSSEVAFFSHATYINVPLSNLAQQTHISVFNFFCLATSQAFETKMGLERHASARQNL